MARKAYSWGLELFHHKYCSFTIRPVFLLNVIVRVVKMWNIFIRMPLCMSPA